MIFGDFEAILPLASGPDLTGGELARHADAGTLDEALRAVAQAEFRGPSYRGNVFERQDVLEADLWLSPGLVRAHRPEPDVFEAPAPLRKLTDDEMLLVAGNNATVVGNPWDDYWDPSLPNDPYPDGGGGSGGSGGSDPSPDLTHEETCGSEDGAAKQIADKIKDAPVVNGRDDWTNIEMGTFVVRTADGRFGALESTIYTDNETDGVTIPNVWGDDYVVGIVHNHPDALGDDSIDLENRYPSPGDWAGLEVLYNAYSPHYPGYDPSIWIMDSEGVLREFKFSERAAIEGLSAPQKWAGQGLEGRERASSCS